MDRFNDAGVSHTAKSSLQKSAITFFQNFLFFQNIVYFKSTWVWPGYPVVFSSPQNIRAMQCLPFCVALSPSVHLHVHVLYCCALCNFFFLGFRQWWSCTDIVVNLNTTIQLPRTWTLARAHTCPHVLAWHMAEIIAIQLQSWLTAWWVASFFPDFLKIHKNRRPHKRLF